MKALMKALLVIALLAISTQALADKYVNGYVKSDGTYVQPYIRSNANNSTYDNYSTKGNVNPYNGNVGHVDPNYTPPSQYQAPKQYNYNNPYNNN